MKKLMKRIILLTFILIIYMVGSVSAVNDFIRDNCGYSYSNKIANNNVFVNYYHLVDNSQSSSDLPVTITLYSPSSNGVDVSLAIGKLIISDKVPAGKKRAYLFEPGTYMASSREASRLFYMDEDGTIGNIAILVGSYSGYYSTKKKCAEEGGDFRVLGEKEKTDGTKANKPNITISDMVVGKWTKFTANGTVKPKNAFDYSKIYETCIHPKDHKSYKIVSGFSSSYSYVRNSSNSNSKAFKAEFGDTKGIPMGACRIQYVANPTLTVTPVSQMVNPGSTVTFNYTYNGDGVVSVASSDSSRATATINTTNKTITVKGVAAAESVTLTVSAQATSNWNAATATAKVQVGKTDVKITLNPTSDSITYGTDSYQFTATSNPSRTLTVSSSKGSATISGSTVKVTGLSTVNAGTKVNIAVNAAETTAYNSASATFPLTINKANIVGSVSISGTLKYNEILTAKPTTTTPTGGCTYAYQWWYSTSSTATSGTNISGATSSTLKLDNATWIGKYIGVTVTASKSNYNNATFNAITSSSPVEKANGYITLNPTTGSTKYGTASATTSISKKHGNEFDTSTTHGNVSIKNSSTVELTNIGSVAAGTVITVKVTCKETSTHKAAEATYKHTITKADMNGSVKISGTNTYGETLAATVSMTKPTSGNTYVYQWWYATSASASSGTNINSATTSTSNKTTLNLDKEVYVGKYIGVTVTVKNSNYKDMEIYDITDDTNNITAKVEKADGYITLDPTSGTSAYETTSASFYVKTSHGGSISAVTEKGSVTPNGTEIKLSNIGKITAGTSFKVTVTCGATTTHKAANATYTHTKIKSNREINMDDNITVTYPTNGSLAFSYTGEDKTATATSNATGKATVTVTDGNKSGTINITPVNVGSATITLTVPESTNYNEAKKTSKVTVAAGDITGSVSISGTCRYNEILTAVTAQIRPTDCKLTYQWYSTSTAGATSGGTAISGATASTYKIGKGLAGKHIYVAVTATRTNYNEKTFYASVGPVQKISVTKPTISGTYTYNGINQQVTKVNYVSSLMTVTGDSAIDAGNYTVTFALIDSANYEWSDKTTGSISYPWEIKVKELTVTWDPNTNPKVTYTYDGNPHAPTPKVTGVNGEIVNLKRNTATVVGDYTAKAEMTSVTNGQKKTSNYKLTNDTKKFEITRAPSKISPTPASLLELVEGTTKPITFSYNGDGALSVVSSDTSKATVSLSGTTVSVTGVKAGTLTVTIKADQGQNYLATSATVNVKVYEKPHVTLTTVATNNVKFNGWTVNGGSINSDVLTLDSDGDYAEKWFLIDGTEWNLGTKFMATSSQNKKTLVVTAEYYNSNFAQVNASTGGSKSNTWYAVGEYNSDTYQVWNTTKGYGTNVKYVKIKLQYSASYTASPLKISEVTFNSGIDENYTGIRINGKANLGTVASVKYLWSKNSSGVSESQITNTLSNGGITYPKYGAKGTYYLWTVVKDSTGGTTIKSSPAIIIDNPELELSFTNENWARERVINVVAFNKENVFDNREMKTYTQNNTTKVNATSATSRFYGGKAWLLKKTGASSQYHGDQESTNILNGLPANGYLLVSSNYKTTNAAGINKFEPAKVLNEGGSEYNTVTVNSNLEILTDGNEHHVYYLQKSNVAISGNVKLNSGMPNWGYSSQAGSMTVDGVQWFVFNSKADINDGIAVKKYAFGDKNIQYFRNDGITITTDTVTVIENGVYTFYMKTANGTERIRKITVRNIDRNPPTVNIDLSGYIEGKFTKDDVTAIVNGTDSPAGVLSIEYSTDNSRWNSCLPVNNTNLIANGDFGKTSSTSVGWDTTRNGNIMADSWTGYQSSVSTANKGYHVHMNTNLFESNVLEFNNRNSEVGLGGRSLYVTTPVQEKLKASTSYTLSFDIYAEEDSMKVTGGVRYNQGSTADFHSGQMNIITADSDVGHWVRKTYTFRTTANTNTTTAATLYIYGHEGAEGTFYIKNVKLEENGSATDWTPMNSEQTITKKKGVVRFTETMDSTVYFRVTDNAGNSTVVSKIIRIDKKAPVISSVKINNGASVTKNIDVIVETIVDDAAYIYTSNTNVPPTRHQWVEYSKYKNHKLSNGNERKTVYVWCKDANDNVSQMVSASIDMKVTYTLTLKNNQWYSGWKDYEVTYFLRKDSAGSSADIDNNWTTSWSERSSNVFEGLAPDVIYHAKTKIEDVVGISEESNELIFKVVFTDTGRLKLEVQ